MPTVYQGYLPANGYLFGNNYGGDIISSASGTYYAIQNGANFWIVPGSNYTVQPCCTAGYTPLAPLPNFATDLGGFFVHMQTDGNLVAYTSATGQDTGQVVPVADSSSQQGYDGAFYAQLTDSGVLQIVTGNSPSDAGGTTIFSAQNGAGAVTGINLTSLTYNLSDAKFSDITNIAIAHIPLINETTTTQQGDGQQNVTYSQSASFSFSVADAVGETITTGLKVGIPAIVKDSFTVGISNTTTITHGHADTSTSSTTFIAGFRPEVPPLTELAVDISGTAATYTIPYSWAGVGTYADGTTANLVGTGTFTGASEGNFSATLSCVIAVLPQACPNGGPIPLALTFTAVPEPSSMAILMTALLATAAVRRRRRRARSR